MNYNFATVDSENRIVYAPDTLGRSLRAPKDWQYHAANYWEFDKTVPEAPEGKYAVVSMLGGAELGEIVTIQEEHVPELDENGEQIDPNDEYKPLIKVVRKRYEFLPIHEPEPVPAPPKRYSKKRFSLALAKRGIFSAFDTWADATEVIPGSGLTVKRVLADSWYMSDSDDEFKAVKTVAEAKFGAERIAEVLAESEDEEW